MKNLQALKSEILNENRDLKSNGMAINGSGEDKISKGQRLSFSIQGIDSVKFMRELRSKINKLDLPQLEDIILTIDFYADEMDRKEVSNKLVQLRSQIESMTDKYEAGDTADTQAMT